MQFSQRIGSVNIHVKLAISSQLQAVIHCTFYSGLYQNTMKMQTRFNSQDENLKWIEENIPTSVLDMYVLLHSSVQNHWKRGGHQSSSCLAMAKTFLSNVLPSLDNVAQGRMHLSGDEISSLLMNIHTAHLMSG